MPLTACPVFNRDFLWGKMERARAYYRFNEVIEKYGFSRDTLIDLGKRGRLHFYIDFHGGVRGKTPQWEGTMLPGPYRIDIPRFHFVLLGKPVDRLYLPWKIQPPERSIQYGFGECVYLLETPEIFSEADLVIMADDLDKPGSPLPNQGALGLRHNNPSRPYYTLPELAGREEDISHQVQGDVSNDSSVRVCGRKAIAAALGISPGTLDNYRRQDGFPSVKDSGNIYVNVDEAKRWIANHQKIRAKKLARNFNR